ncbi:MAG TPA: 16S rRNA (cytosine(1402)-N(4))-methyltransferase RsmH [Planctomycetota bacterium]|nr:16S rRNA (cytosine(1402)-N(4))-methyltransferase RsmH [Planctomycetota bacterium]
MTEAPDRHAPVMAVEMPAWLGAAPGRVLVDLTVGAGGHAGDFLRATAPTGRVLACDRDASALEIAKEALADFGERVRFLHGSAPECLARLAAEGLRADAVLLDLGLSSMQLDEPGRGFSLRADGPLDMRMDRSQELTAAGYLNGVPAEALELALREWGGEPSAARVARAIVQRRASRPFRSTGDLRTVIEAALGRRGGRIHPATRSFQAVRIAVNRELELLEQALPAARALLAPGGRLAVLSFHSGEDRIVKRAFRAFEAGGDELLTPKAVVPGRDETRANPRSRSAKLRVLRRRG